MQTASDPRLVVVDASIAVKWYLLDEVQSQESRVLRNGIIESRIVAVVPSHFHLEVCNAIRNAIRPRRVTLNAARTALETVAMLPVQTISASELMADAFETAIRFDCALYDGMYVALAERAGCPFVHADNRLRNTLGGRFEQELWIEDYVLSD